MGDKKPGRGPKKSNKKIAIAGSQETTAKK
ncbi:hypothetical protein SPACI_018130 [Sporomusa acidovorans DSM 3132]|uniref:Uncharacterized protein n=1 Tax=Sporomusa acidovorans (strain ATCC 49682 / DSM 3132 / Mol) TaxID=1123286 RepID=A0ABZ3J151_SPOA4|nr:hypothetical protein SPACI_11330 [Sporomusa acidovorans DSM 3132]SDE52075.1 hypothetical protein SAMN04488499_101569 [Sporomusa acidovorans]